MWKSQNHVTVWYVMKLMWGFEFHQGVCAHNTSSVLYFSFNPFSVWAESVSTEINTAKWRSRERISSSTHGPPHQIKTRWMWIPPHVTAGLLPQFISQSPGSYKRLIFQSVPSVRAVQKLLLSKPTERVYDLLYCVKSPCLYCVKDLLSACILYKVSDVFKGSRRRQVID